MRAFFDGLIMWSVFPLMLLGCQSPKSEKQEDSAIQVLSSSPTEVQVEPVRFGSFELELYSNGRISSSSTAELYFTSPSSVATVERVFVKNGDRVETGAIIAELSTDEDLMKRVREAELALLRSDLDMRDVLISMGYMPSEKMEEIPEEAIKLAKVKSGYRAAELQLQSAKVDLEGQVLRAPISGIVSDLNTPVHTALDKSKPFCKIADHSRLEIRFPIMESELSLITPGDEVLVRPLAYPELEVSGHVVEINPVINEHGMTEVQADIVSNAKLLPGMNAEVRCIRLVGEQWVVPKSAVVIRSGRNVIFTLEDGHTARWVYVTLLYENSRSYAVKTDELKEGDLVIVSNNINLSHGSEVTVLSENPL